MKVIIDENISNEIKKLLVKAKCDVLDLKDKQLRQLTDRQIIDTAVKENRIILTHDKDFLSFMVDPNCQAKIILIALKPHTEERVTAIGKFLIDSNILVEVKKSAIIDYRQEKITFSII